MPECNDRHLRDGLRYDFEAFATPVGLDPRGNLITFIKCMVRNSGKQEVSFEKGRMTQGRHLVFAGQADGAKPGMPDLDSKFKEAAVEYDFTLEGRRLEFGHFASQRDAGKIARHFSAGIMHKVKDESRRDD